MITRWTVDKEVVGSNPTHGENFISAVLSLSGFTQPIRQNQYRLSVTRVLHIELGLKIRAYVLRWLAVVSDCTGSLGENDTRSARHKQYTHSTHTRIAYAHLTAPHSCDYMGYVHHVGHMMYEKQ